MPTPVRAALAFAVAAGLALGVGAASSCGAPTLTQALTIGSPCKQSTDCGSQPDYACITTMKDGYCTRTCAADTDCPPEGVCVLASGTGSCRLKCDTVANCRFGSYLCKPAVNGATLMASHGYCEASGGAVPPDAGAPNLSTTADMAQPTDGANGG